MASGIMKELKERSIDGQLFKHMHQLMEHGYGADIWRHGGVIAQLVMVHFIRLEDPDKWANDEAGGYATYVDTMNLVRDTLSMNPQVCQLLESLWSSRSDIATYIDFSSIQLLTTHMVNVHTKFVMGCAKYLACTLKQGWSDALDSDSKFSAVQGAVSTYLMVVQNLPLDAGHWHELWAAGDEIALCLMEHFFLHEDQRDERWSAEHVRSPAKYLNRNLQNLRDVVAANPDVCQILNAMKTTRPDLWATIDGRALQRMANCLRSPDLLMGCVAYLETSLVGNWQEGLSNPRAEVQRYIDLYVSNVYQMMGQPPPFTPSLSPRQTRSSMNGSPFFSPRALTHSPTPSPTYQSGLNSPLTHIFTPPASPSALSPAITPTAPLSPYSTPPASPSHHNFQDTTLQALFNLSLNAPPPTHHSPFPSPPTSPSPHHNLPHITPFLTSSPAPSPEPHSPFDLPPSPPQHPSPSSRLLKQAPSFSFHPGISPFAAPATSPPASPHSGIEVVPSTTAMSPTLDPVVSLRQILHTLPAHPTISSPAVSPVTTPRKRDSPPLDMWETQQGSDPDLTPSEVIVPQPATPPATASPHKLEASLPRLPTLTPQPSY